MKYLFYIFIFVISTNSYCQSLTQEEFDKINNRIRELIFSPGHKKDISILFKKLNINYDIVTVNKINDIPLDYVNNIIFPFYQESNEKNKLLLTIYFFTNVPETSKNDLSGLSKAEYHFIVKCQVSLLNNDLFFENQILITQEREILKWFLKTHKNYLTMTNSIYNDYGFIPPPPPPIPNSLEYSPHHLDRMLNKYLDDEDWVNAEITVNKLAELYPNDPLSYYKRGYIKIYTKRLVEGCEDIEKSSILELSQNYPHHKEHFDKMKKICDIK